MELHYTVYCNILAATVLQDDHYSPHTALHTTALQSTAQNCTALHCTALHTTALHCTALHCTCVLHRPWVFWASSLLCPSLCLDTVHKPSVFWAWSLLCPRNCPQALWLSAPRVQCPLCYCPLSTVQCLGTTSFEIYSATLLNYFPPADKYKYKV